MGVSSNSGTAAPRVELCCHCFGTGAVRPVEKIECIGQLHGRHALAINGVSYGGKSWLTFTYDPGQWTSGDIRQFADSYQEQIALAEESLA